MACRKSRSWSVMEIRWTAIGLALFTAPYWTLSAAAGSEWSTLSTQELTSTVSSDNETANATFSSNFSTTSVSTTTSQSFSTGNNSAMAEIFRYDFWGPFWPSTWVVLTGSGFMHYNYSNKPVYQTLVDPDRTNPSQGMLLLSAHAADPNSNSSNLIPIASSFSTRTFTFFYGEIEWKAKISPSNNVLNVFRIGERQWRYVDSLDIKQEYLETPAVQLAVQSGKKGIVRADVLFKSTSSPHQLTSPVSPDSSSGNSSDWIAFPCELCADDLDKNFHTYMLRWTESELVWFIDRVEIYKLKSPHKVPRERMNIVVHMLAGPNFTAADKGEFLLESVIVRQNQPILMMIEPPNYPIFFKDEFNFNTYLNIKEWQPVSGVGEGGLPFIFLADNIRVEGGLLKFLTGSMVDQFNNTKYTLSRVVSTVKNYFLFGEVEWKVKIGNVLPGLSLNIGIFENMCKDNANFGALCATVESQIISQSILFELNHVGQIGPSVRYTDPNNSSQSIIDTQEYNYLNMLIKKNATADLHLYRILWTKDYLVWYVDDVEVKREMNSSKIPNKSLFGISMTMGFDPQLPVPAPAHGNRDTVIAMEVDYVAIRKQSVFDPNVSVTVTTPNETVTGTATIATVLETSAETIPTTELLVNNSTMIGAITASIIILVLCVGGLMFVRFRKLRKKRNKAKSLQNVPHLENIFSFPNLLGTASTGEEILGKGEFGIVFKGVAHNLPTVSRGPTVVAVKTINNSNDPLQQDKFAEEIKTMTKLGKHINVVMLLGIVLKGNLLLLLEYCGSGSLLNYLRSYRPGYIYQHVDENGSLLPFSEYEMKEKWVDTCRSEDREELVDCNMKNHMLTTIDFIKFAHQISRGMEYLTSCFIIHRDLAARNILVGDNRVLKISDFGLAKHGVVNYMMTDEMVKLPILWIPPEAIFKGRFSEKSDIWSFGVLLWEIFSLGRAPFDTPDVQKFSANAFGSWLLKGHQMDRPSGTPLEVYEIMRQCWNLSPEDRPFFAMLNKRLDQFISHIPGGTNYLLVTEPASDDLQFTEEFQRVLCSLSSDMNN